MGAAARGVGGADIARDAATRRVYAAGAGPNEATATEAVIKVREAAQGWIDGLAIEQFLHGPLVAVNADDVAVVVNVPGAAAERVEQITRVLDAVGARLWLIGQAVDGLDAGRCLPLPDRTRAALAAAGGRAGPDAGVSHGGRQRHQPGPVSPRRSALRRGAGADQALSERRV